MVVVPFASVTGLIVAGGLGVRMGGAEKSALAFGGSTIGERTVGVLRSLTRRVIVATPRPEAWRGLPVSVVDDALPGAGPLSGIAAGLSAASTAFVLVVAGDQPLLDEAVLRRMCLCALASGRPVIPLVDGRPEPLHAVHLAAHARRAREALDSGARKAWGFVGEEEVEWMPLSPAEAVSATSVNTPEELAAARIRLGAPSGAE